MTDPKYVRARYLDPDNPKSGKKDFYSPAILGEFDKHYTRKASSPWCKSYIRSSPQAGYEALGNVLRIFPIAWQFRREHAIF